MVEPDKPKPKLKPSHVARLSEAQDDALDEAADLLSRRRGTPVFRADVTREALAKYLPEIGVQWPC